MKKKLQNQTGKDDDIFENVNKFDAFLQWVYDQRFKHPKMFEGEYDWEDLT